ncbi:MAG: Ig-like domain repeat protein, partial [Salinibacterium sp.]|nr:Ig-like domain repeat protein [Salinibacterium sp.]
WDAANADKRLTPTLLASVTEFFVYINQVGTPTTGSIVLDDIRAAGSSTGPTDPPATGPVSVDDFESYASDSDVRAAWAGRDNEADLSLTRTITGSGAQAAGFAYDFASVRYAGIAKNITSDWSGNDRLRLWVKPDGSGNQLVVQFKAGGVSFEGYSALTGTTAAQVSIPFADAVPASYQGLDPALRPTATQLRSVTEVAIFLTSQSGASASAGTVYLDDVRATTADAPDPEPTPVPELAASRTSVSIGGPILLSWQRATVSVRVSSKGDAVPTGAVVLTVDGKTFTSTVGAKGRVKFHLPTLPQGRYQLNVAYAGDGGTAPTVSRTKWIRVLF